MPARSTRVIPTLAIALLATLACAPRLVAQQDARTAHTDRDMPPADSIPAFITRDVNRYFQLPDRPMTLKVAYEFLGPGASQASPGPRTFAMWVRVSDDATVLYEGAMKVAPNERKEFLVLWFSTLDEIRKTPDHLANRFPVAQIPRIIERAARTGRGPSK